MEMLSLSEVHCGYGNIEIIKGISLTVEKGQIVAIIGANGAGKTTTLKTIAGLLPVRSGSITFDGNDITKVKPHDVVKMGISQIPEGRQVFSELSVQDNLIMGGYTISDRHLIKTRIEEQYNRFPRLKERYKQMAGTLSGGEQQMLAIARALISSPRMLLLDEPSMGLSPLFVEEVFEIIQELRDGGMTILLVEQNAGMALEIADYAYALETGKIVIEGTGEEMMRNEEVRKAYLAE
ncbi:MAG TPA: ABC transporter ATP-binding protein [Candidatus Pelethousia gallinarum]|nr:MAG: ABC transporter ATP-binding protein [Clostridiales bacterium]HIR67756.1 ABC transporter ATP-binding protein [Candidatus Pelethousia gallinarum]